MPAAGDAHDRRAGKRHAGRGRRSLHQRRLAHPRTGNAERPFRADAVGQDLVDAPAGRPRSANDGSCGRERQGRDGRRRPQAFRGDGLPAIRQLPLLHRLREHRLAPAGAGPAQRGSRAAGRRGRQPAAAGTLSRPHAARSVGRPAAAHRHRPRPGQGRRSRAARRAAGQSRLQAARGAAHRAAAHLRGVRRHLRLRHHRALGSAIAGRPIRRSIRWPSRRRTAR